MHAISRRLALLALGALALFGTTACGGDDEVDPAGPGADIAGTYTLRTVNGQNVPATVYEGSDLGVQAKVEVLSGSLVLAANQSFTNVTTIRQTIGTGSSSTSDAAASGTYTRNGSTLTLTDPVRAQTFTVTLQADGSLAQSGTISGFPFAARYVKQ